jgi:hypothetical protein
MKGIEIINGAPRVRWSDGSLSLPPIAGGAPDDDDDDDETPPGGGDGGGGGEDKPDSAKELEKWKSLARKHEETAKKNSEAAKRLKEIEDANKSELEKATSAKTEAEQKAAAKERELLVLRVAMRKGLNEEQADRLKGSTEEELEEDADKLLKLFRRSDDDDDDEDDDKETSLSRRPRESFRTGIKPKKEPEETDPRKLAAAALKR